MPIKISVRLEMDEPQRLTKAVRFRLKNFGPALMKSGKYMEEQIDRRFDTKYAPFEFGASSHKRWARNADSTIRRKGHNSVLIGGGRTAGNLRRKIRARVYQGRELHIEYPDYGQYAMDGFFVWKRSKSGNSLVKRPVAPRPFAYPSHKNLEQILDFMVDYIVEGSVKA